MAAVRRPALAARKDEVFAAVLEGLKARLDQLLRDGSRGDPRAYAAGLREAIVEARLGVAAMRDHLAGTERELADEQRQLADAIRRGKLAAMVPDPETVRIADRYAERHRQRVAILERKLAVQKDELAMAERELADMTNEARQATAAHPSDSIAAAWRDLESAGGERPDERERDQAEHDRRRRESAIEAQLAYLKKKLGKQ
ncbi:MAG: hypothetical protein ACTHM9_12515 [Gemmatimonadales bacterium]